MKIIVNGKVYDIDCCNHEEICHLPALVRQDALGTLRQVDRVLCKRKEGGFFILNEVAGAYGGSRMDMSIVPVTDEDAAALAATYVEYDLYVKYFGDPEGTEAEARRAAEKASTELKVANDSKDYWCKRCQDLEMKLEVAEGGDAE